MSKIKNSWLNQYGVEPFEQQQFGSGGAKGVNIINSTFKDIKEKQHGK